jgi:hypothetical protein
LHKTCCWGDAEPGKGPQGIAQVLAVSICQLAVQNCEERGGGGGVWAGVGLGQCPEAVADVAGLQLILVLL